MHRSRNAKQQLQILARVDHHQASAGPGHEHYANEFTEILESDAPRLDAISLGTDEPGYFNGTGQMAHDLVVAVQAQSPARARSTGITGGYGRLISGRSIVVADSGLVPEPPSCRNAHAGALAFEFSHGRDLVACNCGPAPAGLDGDNTLFGRASRIRRQP